MVVRRILFSELVRGLTAGQEDDFIHAQLTLASSCDVGVAEVNGVEGATDETDF